MKKYIFTLLLITFFLFSCSKEEEKIENVKQSKIPFYIETKKLSDFKTKTLFTKEAKLVSLNQVNVVSQASWRIKKINFDVWDKVEKWQVLAVLDDNVLNYYLQLETAKNNLEKAKINYDSTVLALDKAITDATLNYEKLEKAHKLLISDSEEKLKKLETDFSNSNLSFDNSKAKLDYDKALLDYENSLINDKNQIKNYISYVKTNYENLYITYYDIINYLDEIFWVTDKNRYKNDSFETYLWAKNTSLKIDTENKLRILISDYENFKNTDLSFIDESNLFSYMDKLEEKYLELKEILDLAKKNLENSIESVYFTKIIINNYSNQVQLFLQNISSNYTSFVSQKTSIKSFLDTYKKNQISRKEWLDILKKQLEINKDTLDSTITRTKIEIENSINNSENLLKTAKNNLDNAIKNKEITLRSLKSSIKDAEIALKKANDDVLKLTIISPISGIISKKFVDLGQEIWIWTNIFSISWNDQTKTSVFLTKDELNMISLWDKVKINYLWNEIDWVIENISSVASSNFTYEVIINISDKVELIWDFLSVKFLSKNDSILLPLSIVKIISSNKAVLNIIDTENNIKTIEVETWKINWNFVEILSSLKEDEEIILTDMTNYNKKDFDIVRK